MEEKRERGLEIFPFFSHNFTVLWNNALLLKTSQELRMLSSVTINCQVRMIVWIQVLNCQNCNQCLKCQVSRTVFPIAKNCLNFQNCPKLLKLSKIVIKCQKLSKNSKLSKRIKMVNKIKKLSKCWSGHVSSSLWSNVSKVTSL